MKTATTISAIFYLTILAVFVETNYLVQDTNNKIPAPTFYLYYAEAGLGSNMGNFLPTIRIKNGFLIYTYEQNSYLIVKEDHIDTICFKQVRQSSIDSISSLVQQFKDTSIYRFNHCVMSGTIHYMAITNGFDTTKFSLMNTFDYTALRIADILNTYIPVDKQLHANEQMIKDAGDCWARKLKRWEEKDKKKNSKQAQKKSAT